MRTKQLLLCSTVVFFVCLAAFVVMCLVDFAVSSRDTVRFSLTFVDRPIPDMNGYKALVLHNAVSDSSGFQGGNEVLCEEVLYVWFARALFENNLPLSLTFSGYSQSSSIMPQSNLREVATRIVLEDQCRSHSLSRYRLQKSMSYLLWSSSGTPYAWVLPKIMGKCWSKVVWDAVYWDLVGALGTDGERRRILSVSAKYDTGIRFGFTGHGPNLGFVKTETGLRLSFEDGANGPVFASLHVHFPGHLLSDRWFSVSAADSFHDAVFRYVVAELKKPENRGKTIEGTYVKGIFSHEIIVEGQRKLVLPLDASTRRGRAAGGAVEKKDDSKCTLGKWAFADCYDYESVVLPSGIQEIPDGLFFSTWDFSGAVNGVKIPATVRRIGKYAFASNTRLTEIELPESVEEIDDYAFYCCESLTNVVIHGKLKRIGEAAFWGCEKLKRPELPSFVEIGEEAFGGWIPSL